MPPRAPPCRRRRFSHCVRSAWSMREPAVWWRNACCRRRARNLFLFSVRTELFEIGPEVAGLGFVLDAGENHLGAGNPGARILDVFLEGRFVPNDAGLLVRLGI